MMAADAAGAVVAHVDPMVEEKEAPPSADGSVLGFEGLPSMPSVSPFCNDSALFLPVDREVMHFSIDDVQRRTDGVWIYEVAVETSLAMYAPPGYPGVSPSMLRASLTGVAAANGHPHPQAAPPPADSADTSPRTGSSVGGANGGGTNGAPHAVLGPYELIGDDGASTSSQRDKVKLRRTSRYSHFAWFRNAMVAEFPHLIIPPIPPKDFSVSMDKTFGFMSDSDPHDNGAVPPLPVLERQRGLEYFLNYIASHTTLRRSMLLREFMRCESDVSFAALKDRTAQAQAAMRAARQSTSDSIRNLGFQTKHAFTWLKKKVTGKQAEGHGAAPAPEYERLLAYLSTIEASADELRAETETYYLRSIDQVMEEPLGYTCPLPAAEWAGRLCTEGDLTVGARVQTRNGQYGVVRWVGKIRKTPYPDAIHAGIEWDKADSGNTDGTAFGERYFQGKNGPRGCSFLPIHELYVPLPRDPVVDALDAATAHLDTLLAELSPEQERRLFYILSDLQLLKGWAADTVRKPIAYLQSQNLTLASLKQNLAQLQAQKRECVKEELEIEDRICALEEARDTEAAAFAKDVKRLHLTIGGLYRGALQNFITYNATQETHIGLDAAILAAAGGIECVWDEGTGGVDVVSGDVGDNVGE